MAACTAFVVLVLVHQSKQPKEGICMYKAMAQKKQLKAVLESSHVGGGVGWEGSGAAARAISVSVERTAAA